MNLIELTEYLVKSVSKNPDMVSVKQFNNAEEKVIQILVDKDDISSIIGKNGTIIGSIRNIVNLAAYNKNEETVKICIDSF